MQVFDLEAQGLRALNSTLHTLNGQSNETAWEIVNPKGSHAIAVGVDAPLDITVRVGCDIAYETSVPTPVLFVLRPRLEGRVLVMQEKLSFGIGLPSYEFQDSHGNLAYRSTLMPGRNDILHDALVAVSSRPDDRDVRGPVVPVGQLPSDVLRYVLPSR